MHLSRRNLFFSIFLFLYSLFSSSVQGSSSSLSNSSTAPIPSPLYHSRLSFPFFFAHLKKFHSSKIQLKGIEFCDLEITIVRFESRSIPNFAYFISGFIAFTSVHSKLFWHVHLPVHDMISCNFELWFNFLLCGWSINVNTI